MRLGSARFGTARYATPGSQPVTSPVPLELIPFGLVPFGLKPFGFGSAPASPPPPAPIFDPILGFGEWLSTQLGMPVSPDHLQIGDPLPQVTYAIVDADEPITLDGMGGLGNWSVQIDAWGADPEGPPLIQARIRRALTGYRGKMGLTFCHTAKPGRMLSSYTPYPTNSTSGVYRRMVEWSLLLQY